MVFSMNLVRVQIIYQHVQNPQPPGKILRYNPRSVGQPWSAKLGGCWCFELTGIVKQGCEKSTSTKPKYPDMESIFAMILLKQDSNKHWILPI